RVVLPQAFDGEFDHDDVKGFEDAGPMHGIAKPKLLVFDLFTIFAKDQKVWIQLAPTFAAGGRWHIIGAGELVVTVRRHGRVSSFGIVALARIAYRLD